MERWCMNYELAKQLKDAGFPSGKENEDYYEEFRQWIPPTLSELIAAVLKLTPRFVLECETGKNLEEAVARLWLELNANKR